MLLSNSKVCFLLIIDGIYLKVEEDFCLNLAFYSNLLGEHIPK